MYFIDHLLAAATVATAVSTIFVAGTLLAQLIDAQHTGPWLSRARCALMNNSDACDPNIVGGRGWLHSIQFLAIVCAAWAALTGFFGGLILHFYLDRLL